MSPVQEDQERSTSKAADAPLRSIRGGEWQEALGESFQVRLRVEIRLKEMEKTWWRRVRLPRLRAFAGQRSSKHDGVSRVMS